MPAVVVAVGGVISGTSWSHADALSAVNPHGDRALSTKAQPYDVQLVAPVQGGLVGWCMTYDTSRRSGGKCPVVPTAARPIVAESWSSSSAPAVTEVVALIRQQAALEIQIMNAGGPAVAAEWALATTRRRLVAYPEALAAVLHTARALRRSPDMVSVRDVTAFGGSN